MAEERGSRVAAYVPDLMDRSRLAGIPAIEFVADARDLNGVDAEIVVVDLSRPGVLDVVASLRGRRVIGFGSHVDRALLESARAAGCSEVMARSAFFARAREMLST